MDRPTLADALRNRESVLRAFVSPDGGLKRMPTKITKRLVVLDHIARTFAIGERWDEREVNDRLRRFHPDVASLRRYLVEEEFFERGDGCYWRAGGTTEV